MKKILQQSIVVAGLIAGTPANAEQEISVVESFAIQPAIRSVQLSPDGKQLALVRATSKDGDYIIEIHQTNSLAKEPVTLGADKMRVSGVSWLNNEKIGVSFRQFLEDRAPFCDKAARQPADVELAPGQGERIPYFHTGTHFPASHR